MYTGGSGQLAVMAELLQRGMNTAAPEVDLGEDVLTFRQGRAAVVHVQVKTATAEALKEPGRYAARASVPFLQLREPDDVRLYYVFAVRLGERWTDFLVISRPELNRLHADEGVGYPNHRAGELQLYFACTPESLTCSGRDMGPYRNAWRTPPLDWPNGIAPPTAASPGPPEGAP